MARQKKIKELNQLDGKIHSPTISVDEVWGFEKSKFPTHNAQEYEASLKVMNKIDLQDVALSLGLYPTDDRNVQIDRIMNEFSKSVAAFNAARSPRRHQLNISKAGRDLLAEGA